MSSPLFSSFPVKKVVHSASDNTNVGITFTRAQPTLFYSLDQYSIKAREDDRDWTNLDPTLRTRSKQLRRLLDLFHLLVYRNRKGDSQRCVKILSILLRSYEFPVEDFWSMGLGLIDMIRLDRDWKGDRNRQGRGIYDEDDDDNDVFSDQDQDDEDEDVEMRDAQDDRDARRRFDLETSNRRLKYLLAKFERERNLKQVLTKEIVLEYIFQEKYSEAYDFLELNLHNKIFKPVAEVHCLAGLLNLYIGLQTPNPTLKKSNSQSQYHSYSQAQDEEDEDDEGEDDFNPTFPHRLSHSSLSNLPTAILASSNEHFKRGLESKEIGKWSWNDRSRTNRLLIQNDIKRKKAFGKVLRKSEEKFWGVGKGWRVQVEEESQDDEDDDDDEDESDSEEIAFRNQNSNSKGKGKEKDKNLSKVDKKRKRSEKDSDSNSDSAESLDEEDRKLRRENDRDKREDSDDSWQTEEEVEVEEARKNSKMGIPNTEINWAEELCRVYVDLINEVLESKGLTSSRSNSQFGGSRSNSQQTFRSNSQQFLGGISRSNSQQLFGTPSARGSPLVQRGLGGSQSNSNLGGGTRSNQSMGGSNLGDDEDEESEDEEEEEQEKLIFETLESASDSDDEEDDDDDDVEDRGLA